MRKYMVIQVALLVFLVSPVLAGPETLLYKDHDVELEGLLYRPAAGGTVPVVILFHQWMGPGENEQHRAEQFAAMGYAAFVADVYGRGIRAGNRQEAGELAGKYRGDRPLMRARAQAALDFVRTLPDLDRQRIVAIGYCFGGGVVLELARSGAELTGVVSVHGNLDTPLPAAPGTVKASVLVQHGADDPHVTQESVALFVQEMQKTGADWQLVQYGNAVHAFSDPGAGDDPAKGAAYNALADKRSFELQKDFLAEHF